MKFTPFYYVRVRRNLAVTAVLLLGGATAYAQSTDIAIGPNVLQPAVKRLGVNLGLQNFYDSGQIMKNLAFRNPGFEGEIFQSTIRCISGTVNTCVDDDPYSGWPNGFWNGATVEVFYGRSQGRKEIVASYTAAKAPAGGTFTFQGVGTAPATGDYMIVRLNVPGNPAAGWWTTTAGTATITGNTTDLPEGTAGKQTVALRAPAASDLATLTSYFDSTAGKAFIAMNGSFQISFKAKGLGGSNSVAVSVQRGGVGTYFSQIVPLPNSWATYNFTFTAAEAEGVPGSVALNFSTVGPDALYLDDVTLVQTDSDPANPTAFRDPVVKALQTLNPGVLRFWVSQLGDSVDNLIAPPFARLRSGYSAFSNQQDAISFGLPEFLQLCETIGAEPWVVTPVTLSTAEAAHLVEFLAGSHSTPYGAKRAALGHPAPWTGSFPKIHLEFGNEAWNGGFKGGGIEYSAPYGQRAQAIFGAMRADASFLASAFDLVLGGQSAAPMRNQDIQNNCNNNDTFALAPYMMYTIDSFATNEALFGPTFAAAEAFHSPTSAADGFPGGLILQNQKAMQASNHPVPLALYEMNLHTVSGGITQAALNNYASSLGAGLAVVDSMLQQMRQGILTQNLFALQQYKFLRDDGKSVFLWGSVVDMGVTDRRRPQYLALQLANLGIGSGSFASHKPLLGESLKTSIAPVPRTTMLQTTHGGADPTWNQPLVNTVQLAGAHYLQSFAFSNGLHRSLIVFNLHRTASLPITMSGPNLPTGEVEIQQLTSAAITDTNEDSNKVGITVKTVDPFKPTTPYSLPPYSMTLFRWTERTAAKAASPIVGTTVLEAMGLKALYRSSPNRGGPEPLVE